MPIKGCFIFTFGIPFFRVYSEDKRSFTDYEVHLEDVFVTLEGNGLKLVKGEKASYITYKLPPTLDTPERDAKTMTWAEGQKAERQKSYLKPAKKD